MTTTPRYRFATAAAALALSCALTGTSASAALDMVVGTRITVPNKPASDCMTRAQGALNTVLQNAIKAGDDGVNWLGFGRPGGASQPSAAAVIHCLPVDNGYVATFACSTEVPPNPDTADALCTKLVAAFGTP